MGNKPKRVIYGSEGLSGITFACNSMANHLEQPSTLGLSHALSIKQELETVHAELLLDLAGLYIFSATFKQAEDVSRWFGLDSFALLTDFRVSSDPIQSDRPSAHPQHV